MLTIQNIDRLVGYQFTNAWEVVDINENNQRGFAAYEINLAKFNTIYDPNTFAPHKRVSATTMIVLNREQMNGKYEMYESPYRQGHSLQMDISLMDSMSKLIAAIEFLI
jgi:hypothetical protein